MLSVDLIIEGLLPPSPHFSVQFTAGAANQPSWAASPARARRRCMESSPPVRSGGGLLSLVRSSALSVTIICWLSASGRSLANAHVKRCVWKVGILEPQFGRCKVPWHLAQRKHYLWLPGDIQAAKMLIKILIHNQRGASRSEFHQSHN